MGKTEFDIAFGKSLRAYRENAKISQVQAGQAVNHTHSVISKYESGDRTPSPTTVNCLANTYGTTAGDFYSLANDIKTIYLQGEKSSGKKESK